MKRMDEVSVIEKDENDDGIGDDDDNTKIEEKSLYNCSLCQKHLIFINKTTTVSSSSSWYHHHHHHNQQHQFHHHHHHHYDHHHHHHYHHHHYYHHHIDYIIT